MSSGRRSCSVTSLSSASICPWSRPVVGAEQPADYQGHDEPGADLGLPAPLLDVEATAHRVRDPIHLIPEDDRGDRVPAARVLTLAHREHGRDDLTRMALLHATAAR